MEWQGIGLGSYLPYRVIVRLHQDNECEVLCMLGKKHVCWKKNKKIPLLQKCIFIIVIIIIS